MDSKMVESVSDFETDDEEVDIYQLEREIKNIGTYKKKPKPQLKHSKSLAVLLELIPGLVMFTLGAGHIYNKHYWKGIFMMIFYWIIALCEISAFAILTVTYGDYKLLALLPIFIIINIIIIALSVRSAYTEAA